MPFENEVRVFKKFKERGQCENVILSLQYGWLDSTRFYVDMELCFINLRQFIIFLRNSGADMLKTLSFWDFPSHRQLECFTLWDIMRQMIRGLDFIHSQKEIHRDLKPENGNMPVLPAHPVSC